MQQHIQAMKQTTIKYQTILDKLTDIRAKEVLADTYVNDLTSAQAKDINKKITKLRNKAYKLFDDFNKKNY